MDYINCSIGIFAHNEAGNIGQLLKAIMASELSVAKISEIIVVSSASSDGTDEIVTAFATDNPKVQLLTQARREGKSAAINLFLKAAKEQICVVISGDVLPAKDTIEQLVAAFNNPKTGASGGRPMPVNREDSFIGYAVHLLWRLHHRMALISPKLGEMIAFRKVMDAIPAESAVDEASIEAIVRAQGLKLKYIPKVIIHNKGPENIKDFIKQRRRIQNGHLWLKAKQHYHVSSQNESTLIRVTMAELKDNPQNWGKLIAVMALEFYCRTLGSWDYYVQGRNPFAWDIAKSAKNLGTGVK